MNSLLPRLSWALCLLVFSIVMSLAGPVTAGAQDSPRPDKAAQDAPIDVETFSSGVRVGLSDHRNEEYFRKYEAFLNWYLPWALRSTSGWVISSRLDFTGALINGAGTNGFFGSVGPSMAVRKKGWIFMIDLGISPGYLSEDRYGKEDLCGHFQFLVHGGITLLSLRPVGLGYRFQHISNAGIQQPNPGLNTHSLELSYRF